MICGGFIPKLRSYLGSIWLELGLGLDLSGLCVAGVVASRAQWRFGIFAVGLQMAIKLNQVKYVVYHISNIGSKVLIVWCTNTKLFIIVFMRIQLNETFSTRHHNACDWE